jgi:glucan biosynthesis protein C
VHNNRRWTLPPTSPSPGIERHHGLDWLRIGAFGLLILFHIGLYFAPGHWIVKSPEPAPWAAWPLAAIVPWRLTVLFAVSGYATAAMMQRFPELNAFVVERSKRLLIPLVFAMLVVIPPQDWVRLEVSGVDHPYGYYLLHDNFSFSEHAGAFFPNWEHLWFLGVLWAYTVLLASLAALIAQRRKRVGRLLAWLTDGRRLLYIPPLFILGSMALLQKLHLWWLAESGDYFPAFLFGIAYAHSQQLRDATARLARAAATLSVAALAAIWWLMATVPANPGSAREMIALAASSLMSWSMLIAMFHLADRFLRFDHKLRQPLAAAVFPAYIVHQTIIVVLGWYLARWSIVGLPAFIAQLAAVLAGCIAAWWLARTFSVVGSLLGMPHKSRGGGAPQLREGAYTA